jgi:hypothetical protein
MASALEGFAGLDLSPAQFHALAAAAAENRRMRHAMYDRSPRRKIMARKYQSSKLAKIAKQKYSQSQKEKIAVKKYKQSQNSCGRSASPYHVSRVTKLAGLQKCVSSKTSVSGMTAVFNIKLVAILDIVKGNKSISN